jgi:hypothetical protein
MWGDDDIINFSTFVSPLFKVGLVGFVFLERIFSHTDVFDKGASRGADKCAGAALEAEGYA